MVGFSSICVGLFRLNVRVFVFCCGRKQGGACECGGWVWDGVCGSGEAIIGCCFGIMMGRELMECVMLGLLMPSLGSCLSFCALPMLLVNFA